MYQHFSLDLYHVVVSAVAYLDHADNRNQRPAKFSVLIITDNTTSIVDDAHSQLSQH